MKVSFKIWTYRLLSISIPFVLIIVIELGLRLFEVSPSINLFIDAPENNDYKVFNPYFSRPYFSDIKNTTSGFYEPFKKKKDANTVRIFVQGASTAIGFPYFNNGSFHRMLKYRLEQSYPDKNIEIINVSLTAINSYTLADQVDEIIECKPDAVLIYAGHNEYYGAMGVAATSGLGGNPFIVRVLIRLNKLHLIQALKSLLLSNDDQINNLQHHNLMQEMAENSIITYGSDKYKNGLEQFRRNLDRLLMDYQKSDVPVFISTIASNIRDLPPFVSITANEDSLILSNSANKAKELLSKADTIGAREHLQNAFKADSTFAEIHYLLGKIYLWQNDMVQAKAHFLKAKQYDALRFRAPGEMNSIIKQLASKHDAVLVDSKSELEAHANHNIIGEEIMLEHVHPNLYGYSLIADAFYNTLLDTLMHDGAARYVSYGEFKKEMPLTVIDSLRGYYAIILMKEKWPFNEPKYDNIFGDVKTKPEEIAGMLAINQITWDQSMEMLYKHYHSQGKTKRAIKVAEATVLEHPMNVDLIAKCAQLLAKEGNYQKATFYYRKAFQINQSPSLARRIAQYLIQSDEFDNAKKFLEYSLEHDNTDAISQQAIKAINEVQTIKDTITNSTKNVQLYITLAMNYLKLGLKEKAYDNFLLAKSLEPENIIIKDMETRIFNKFQK